MIRPFWHPVSVPYRGATFLNNTWVIMAMLGQRFPSPIGELHFSIVFRSKQLTLFQSFRPLSGSYISQLSEIDRTFLMLRFRPLSGSYISQYHPRNPMSCLGRIGGLRGKSNFIEIQLFWKVKSSHKSSI